MKKELQMQLVEKYPSVFKDYGGDMKRTCMAWGIECGDGWYNIIDELCAGLSKYPDVFAAQIKEKFGGLRFYIHGSTNENFDEVFKLTNTAEVTSLKTCEACGSPGRRQGGGWIRTLCDACAGVDDAR